MVAWASILSFNNIEWAIHGKSLVTIWEVNSWNRYCIWDWSDSWGFHIIQKCNQADARGECWLKMYIRLSY